MCTLLDLMKVVDENVPMWKSIRNCATKAIGEIKVNVFARSLTLNLNLTIYFGVLQKIFDFNGSDKDFQDRFLLEMKLFTEMTAHMTGREKFELVHDPGELFTSFANSTDWMSILMYDFFFSRFHFSQTPKVGRGTSHFVELECCIPVNRIKIDFH